MKSVINERFIRTLKNKNYKKKTGDASSAYLDYLDGSFDDYNNAYHYCIGRKP